jgi:uncharacterized lipoprotein YddW (UPF0748 family)
VHAWVNVNLIADAEPPAARSHITYVHPDWLMVPRDLAGEAARLNPRSPEYLTMLTRYARANSDRLEGLFLSPLQPAAVDYTVKVISDIADRYPVDGLHFDYARFPGDDFDYSPGALSQFRAQLMPQLTRAERRAYEARAVERPIFYTQMFPQRWQELRRAKMTALVAELRGAIRRARPGALVSAAVWPDANDAASHRMQDWRTWLDAGLIDVVCPMAYTTDAALFRSQIAAAKQIAGRHPVWAGIGAFHLSAADTVANIHAARRLGAEGVSLFSYDNLGPHNNAHPDYLSTVAQGAFVRP